MTDAPGVASILVANVPPRVRMCGSFGLCLINGLWASEEKCGPDSHFPVAFFVCLLFSSAPVAAAMDAELFDSLQNDFYTDQTVPAYYIHNFSIDDLRLAVGFTVPSDGPYQLNPVELLVAARISTTQNLTVTLYGDAPAASFPGPGDQLQNADESACAPDGSGTITVPLTTVAPGRAEPAARRKYWLAPSPPRTWQLHGRLLVHQPHEPARRRLPASARSTARTGDLRQPEPPAHEDHRHAGARAGGARRCCRPRRAHARTSPPSPSALTPPARRQGSQPWPRRTSSTTRMTA